MDTNEIPFAPLPTSLSKRVVFFSLKKKKKKRVISQAQAEIHICM